MSSPMTPEQIETRAEKKGLNALKWREIYYKSNRAHDVRISEQFSLVEKFRARFSVAVVCNEFGVHRSSYKYWRQPKKPDAHEWHYSVLFLKAITNVMAPQALKYYWLFLAFQWQGLYLEDD